MFIKIMRKNKLWIILTSIVIIISSMSMVYGGYSLSFLYNAMDYTENAIDKLLSDTFKVMVIWIVALILLYVKNIIKAYTICKIRNELRTNMTDKIVSLDYEEFYKKDTGHYVSWLTNDVNQITGQAFVSFFTIVDNIATAIFSLVAMLYLNLYIGVTAIILFGLIAIVPQMFGKMMATVSEQLSTGQEKFVESVKENIMGFEVFKSFNLFSRLRSKLYKGSEEVENSIFKYSKKESFVNVIVASVNLLSQVVLIVLTLHLAIRNLAPAGGVLAVGNLAGSFFSGVGGAVQGIISRKAAKPIFNKFLVKNSSKCKNNLKMLEKIVVKDLDFSYGDHQILYKLNAEFEVGKKYAIIGSSGSGKSTFAKILSGLLVSYTGAVSLNDSDLREVSPESVYSNISYISQNVYLFQGTLRENITLGEEFSDEDINRALEQSRLIDFVNETQQGLEFIVHENGKNLSGGQRQRLALTRAMIRKVRFIIIDEGTSSLDNENALEIERNLVSSEKFGVIIITHHLKEEIREKLNEVYVINNVRENDREHKSH